MIWGTRLSLLEMLRGGTTTYADMYYFEDAVARVTKEAGMRGVLGETIIDFPAPDNKTTPQASPTRKNSSSTGKVTRSSRRPLRRTRFTRCRRKRCRKRPRWRVATTRQS